MSFDRYYACFDYHVAYFDYHAAYFDYYFDYFDYYLAYFELNWDFGFLNLKFDHSYSLVAAVVIVRYFSANAIVLDYLKEPHHAIVAYYFKYYYADCYFLY